MRADSASSAPARSMEATAMSTSTDVITSEMGMRWTSTSNIDRSMASGFIPWLIVRFPCGSRSITRTRFPSSRSATPRFNVVVVFATPPFWFASAMTFAISAPSAAGAAEGAGEGVGTACNRGGSSAAVAASSTGSEAGSGRGWSRGSKRERAMAAPPSRHATKLLQACSILSVPVVEALADACDELEPDEVHLPRAGVVADLSGLSRPVHEQRHPGVAAPECVRDTRARGTADDRAGANRMLVDAVLLPEQNVAIALEDDEYLLFERMTVRRRVQLPREHLRMSDPCLARSHRPSGKADTTADGGRLPLVGLEVGNVHDRRGPQRDLTELGWPDCGLARPRVVLLRADRHPGLAEPGDAGTREPRDSLRVGALAEGEHVEPIRTRQQRVAALEREVQEAVSGMHLIGGVVALALPLDRDSRPAEHVEDLLLGALEVEGRRPLPGIDLDALEADPLRVSTREARPR